MDRLTIVLHYPGAARMWKVWADGENAIDFRRDLSGGARCTASYAAGELLYFLRKSLPDFELTVAEAIPKTGLYIELEIRGNGHCGSFELKPVKNGIRVTGHGRNGLLNGCYELLRIQGWRWLEPGIYGESAPDNPTLDFLKAKGKFTPSFRHRMIDQYRESDDSMELLRWFSRNRINVVFRKAATGKFADKLGMLSRRGGHLLQKIMAPDVPMDDGRTLWEAHPEWYGLPADGKRNKELAMRTQLCLSNKAMIRWLSAKICTILQTEMKDIDILDLWGFDTWGKTCSCPHCTDMGNGSDQNLWLLSAIQSYLRRHLDRPVMLNTVSYEGTATMDPPTKPVPRNLTDSGCMVIFYPIRRCYRHLLADRGCELNRCYDKSLRGWRKQAPELALWAGEYYNVSYHEDLPLVFSSLIPAEMRYYFKHGCSGATYMHNLSPNWGVRSLTQLLHTQFAWDVHTDEKSFLNEYFQRKYGRHAAPMRRAYGLLEEAFRDVTLWRNWSGSFQSAKMLFSEFNGIAPEKDFAVAHYPEAAAALKAIRLAVKQAEQAKALIKTCLKEERRNNWHALPLYGDPVQPITPLDLERSRYYDKYEYRLSEDLRGVIYGADSLRFILAMAEYYHALHLGRPARKQWLALEETADKLNEYWVPVTYENPGPGVRILDGLSRTQQRAALTRCRGARLRQKEGNEK